MTARSPLLLIDALEETIVGQRNAIESLVIALLAGGHVLLEGPPGVAKTLACRCLAAALTGTFKRIQFTPDLLPSDISGTRIFDQRSGEFQTVLGPVFANVVLADEINRAPAKVQSALLEAMQEHQVTIGTQTHALPDPFVVLATMNPIDADGTYPLPHAQLDRFLFKIETGYPQPEEEAAILERFAVEDRLPHTAVASIDDVHAWRGQAHAVHLDEKVKRYITDIVAMTRVEHPYVRWGVSPRATLGLAFASRAKAFLEGRDFVLPDDVRTLAPRVIAHRVVFSHRVAADGARPADIIAAMISAVPAP